MELRRVNVVLPDGGGKRFAIGGARGDDGLIYGSREKAMHEIDVASVLDSVENRAIGLDEFELVPADLRHFQARLLGKAHNASLEEPQSFRAAIELVAALE